MKNIKHFKMILAGDSLLVKAATLGLFVVVAAFLAFTSYLVYVRRKYSHIPGPKLDNFILGNIPHLKRERAKGKTIYQILMDWFQIHGPVFVVWAFHRPFVAVLGPENTKRVLLTLNLPKSEQAYANVHSVYGQRAAGRGILTEFDNSVWQKKRTMLNPAFHRRYLMNLMPAFNSICDKFLEKIGSFAASKTPVNMAEEFSRATLDIIGKVAFNLDLNAVQDDNSPFHVANSTTLKGMQESMKDKLWRFNVMTYPFQWKAIEAAKFLREFGEKVIVERRDAIQRGEDTPQDILAHIINMMEKDASITMEQLVDDFVTFFIAGQETTSNQLAFTVLELGRNPEMEDRVVQEIFQVLDGRRFVEYADLGQLQYLGQVLKESLRLHPPIGSTARITTEDTDIGGYLIPAGTEICPSQFVTHRCPQTWQDPEKFNPDRFAPSPTHTILGPMYFPFTIGPRTCIGKTLAQFESKVLMARLYQEYELTLVPGQSFGYEETITTRPKGGVWCTVKKRGEP